MSGETKKYCPLNRDYVCGFECAWFYSESRNVNCKCGLMNILAEQLKILSTIKETYPPRRVDPLRKFMGDLEND